MATFPAFVNINWGIVLTTILSSLGSSVILALFWGLHRQLRQVVTRERLLAVVKHPKLRTAREILGDLVSLYFLFFETYQARRAYAGYHRGLCVGIAIGILTTRVMAALFEFGKFLSIATMLSATPQILGDQQDAKRQYHRAYWLFLWHLWSTALAVGLALSTY